MKPYYQDDYVTLYNGDCREIIPRLDTKFDLLLTDPPYGIKRSGQIETFVKNPKHKRKLHNDFGWDKNRPDKKTFTLLLSLALNSIIWGGNYFSDLLPAKMGWLYWDKGQNGLSMSDGELAWTSMDKALRAFVCNRCELIGSVHPTQKPLSLIKWCITQAPDNVKTILDPFAGSGTTGVAAKELNRKCVLIELEEKYCEIAARRLSQEVFNFKEV
jgi:DNA modification methylase